MPQLGGYRAYIPALLPPSPAIVFDNEMLDLLSKSSVALGRLDGISRISPNADLFVAMYGNKESVLSSQIEGNAGIVN